jgi:hypothetical protein
VSHHTEVTINVLFKFLIGVCATAVLVWTLEPAASAAHADSPTPAAASTPTPTPSSATPPAIDPSQLPPAIQAAKTLRESLSDTQRNALSSIMDGHKPALAAAKAQLDDASVAQAGGAPVDTASVKQAHMTLRSVLASLDSEVSNMLDTNQRTQFEARRSNLRKARTANDVGPVPAAASDPAASFTFNGPYAEYSGVEQSEAFFFQPATTPGDLTCQYAPTDRFFSQSPGDFECAVEAADQAYEFSYYNYLSAGRSQSLNSTLWSYWSMFYANAAFSNVVAAPVTAELTYQSAYFAASTACLYADADLDISNLTDFELLADALARVFIANSFADLTGTAPVFTYPRFGGAPC